MHTDAWDEQDSLPSEEAALIALRTQQIIAYETGVADVVDPLGGSYYIERLTSDLEEEAWEYIERIDNMGGMVRAVKDKYPKSEIMKSSYEFSKKLESGEAIIVGVNKFLNESAAEARTMFRANPRDREMQCERLRKFRSERNSVDVAHALRQVEQDARGNKNIMPSIIEAVKSRSTEGEIVQVLKDVYGEYVEN